ncbi:MAG: hypothetical protein FWH27_15855 [Planctomycetaceae bacterium]|nr:hypothetical protein [Planctomycetaceae bacterium]
MKRSIYKYSLADGVVSMPKNARILKVGMQDGIPCLWATVDPNAERETREFSILGTGCIIPNRWKYIGTMFDRQHVWHVFENFGQLMED